MMSVIWIFLKLAFFYKDEMAVEEYLHNELVIRKGLLNEEAFNDIHSIGGVALISYKITYAFAIGRVIKGLWLGMLLALVTLLPALCLYVACLYVLFNKVDANVLIYIVRGITPVLAAYFLYQAYTYLQKGFKHFPLFSFMMLSSFAFVLVFILQWPVTLILCFSIFFFLCFMKGGNING